VVVDEDELTGPSQDIQCFNRIKPNIIDKGSTLDKINVKIGIITITSGSTGTWTNVKNNFTLSLAQGEEQLFQTNYSTHDTGKYGNHNPRNLTMLYSGHNLFAAMAFQNEYTYHDSYYTNYEIEWTCNDTSLVLPDSDKDVHRIIFYKYTQYVSGRLSRFSEALEISRSGCENIVISRYLIMLIIYIFYTNTE